MPNRTLSLACLGLLLAAPIAAQKDAAPKPQEPHHVVLKFPRDKAKPIAVVGSTTLTLGDLVSHIDARHYTGFAKLLETQPTFQAYLKSDLMAPWVRHFADMEAIKQSLGDEYLDLVLLEQAQSAALKAGFEAHLEAYVGNLRAQGRPTELSQQRVDSLLKNYQLKHGLASELQGMLDLLEKDDYTRPQLRDFFNDNARYFGGQVTIAHILVQHRDGGTGLLLKEEGLKRANQRIAAIKAELRPDGSNFAMVAQRYSDDQRTGKTGGVLPGLKRFDDRMPATICRAAWSLRDGAISEDVVESQYGYHFIQRLEFNQQIFVLFTDDAIPTIRFVMRRAMQEKRLLGARQKTGRRLLL